MIQDSLKRFKGKRIDDLVRFEVDDVLEAFLGHLTDEISKMDNKPEIIVLEARKLQPSCAIHYFHSLLRERNIGSQVRICDGEPVQGYIVNLDERVQQYMDTL